jgi:endoglucanase
MAAPDMVCVEVRDAPITYGQVFSIGSSIALTSPNAITITNVSASPIDGSIRITCPGAFVESQYFGYLASGSIGIAGVVGVPNCNGSWNSTRIDDNSIDLCATRFTGTWTPGTGKAWRYDVWTTYAPAGRRGWVFGANQEYFRACDLAPDAFVNRAAVKVPGNWASFGGRSVVAVYVKSKNYGDGYNDSADGGQFGRTSTLKHYVFLKLDGPLTQGGPYAIVNSTAGISTNLTWNDRSTRTIAICVNQIGYKTSDVGKTAYLALWVPGAPNEGAMDYSAFTQFDVINGAGTTVAGPFSITQRILATEAETRIGLQIDNIASGYSSTDGRSAYNSTDPAKRHAVTAWSATDPAVFTVSTPHGFAVGKRLRFEDIMNSGTYRSGAGYYVNHTVRVASIVSPTQFTLTDFLEDGAPVRGALSPTYADWLAAGNPQGYLVEQYESSRAGTNTYEMQFGSYNTATDGTYRLRVAGLGTSDPFPIRTSAWGDLAKIMAGGEYNHRHGLAHDGRFGQTRGASYIDGVVNAGNYGKIYQSKLPYGWGWGGNVAGGAPVVQEQTAARPDWFFPTGTPGQWYQSNYGLGGGSWADAGDWCTRLNGVSGACYAFVELALLRPAHAAATNYGLPKLLEMFPSVPEYAGTNGLPEMFTQAVFGMECYRRCQHGPGSYLPEGAVPGGLMMDTGTGTTASSCDRTHGIGFANLPEQFSNFHYAFAAAKIAQGFYAYGFTAAGNMWRDSAVKAWDWAQLIYTDSTARFAYFDGLGVEALLATGKYSNGAWTHSMYVASVEEINQTYISGVARNNSAATLYRLTGGANYKTVIETDLGYGGGNPNGIWFDTNGGIQLAAWEYYRTPGINAQAKQVLGDTFQGCWTRNVAGLELFSTPPPKQPYRTMFVADNGVIFFGIHGIDLSAVHWAFIASHVITGDSRFLQVLQDGMGFIMGANQTGFSSVSGTGTRAHEAIFNADDIYTGHHCAPGIGCYMFTGVGAWFYDFGQWHGSFNAASIEGPEITFEAADKVFERHVVPGRYATPVYDAAWEVVFHLSLTERSIQQDVFPLQNVAFYLDSWDEVPKTTAAVTVSSNNNPSDVGESVTFTATVTGTGGPPTGTVTFRDNGSPIGSGILAGGFATFTLTGLLVGDHSITAFYSGDVTFAPAGSGVLTQQVAGIPPPPGPNPYQFSVFAM